MTAAELVQFIREQPEDREQLEVDESLHYNAGLFWRPSNARSRSPFMLSPVPAHHGNITRSAVAGPFFRGAATEGTADASLAGVYE